MKMERYLIVIGTRPEAIKMCPLVLAMRAAGLACRVVLTGQHREMAREVLQFFGVGADADLDVMRTGQSLAVLTERLLGALRHELARDADYTACLVHGDTATAFAAALSCFYAGIPVVHVEAGLRSGDVHAPFPEEFYRRAVDAMSALWLAPTERAVGHLFAEGAPAACVYTVGNTATDAVRLCLESGVDHPLLNESDGRRLVLLTAHRRELDERSRHALLRAIRTRIEGRRDVHLIVPVHPSPAVRATVSAAFEGCVNVRMTPPLPLPLMQQLLARASLLLTDSGGLQEEATYLGIPTLVLRTRTERPEGVEAGVLATVGTDPHRVGEELGALLDDGARLARMRRPSSVYGDGYVSERIVRILSEWGRAR
jgi:UDP-N-acetylglucosamine 2-epimerase (non-hydrolysing)